MRVVIVAASVVAVAVGVWAAEAAAPIPPKCSALNTQRHGRLVTGVNTGGPWYVRQCGPGRAVVRVRGKSFKSFTIEGGTCRRGQNTVGFGLTGYGGVRGKGFFLRLAPVGTDARPGRYVRPGRVPIIDGEVQLPGFGLDLPHQGTAIISKDLKSATFTLGGPPRVTGSWTCGSPWGSGPPR